MLIISISGVGLRTNEFTLISGMEDRKYSLPFNLGSVVSPSSWDSLGRSQMLTALMRDTFSASKACPYCHCSIVRDFFFHPEFLTLYESRYCSCWVYFVPVFICIDLNIGNRKIFYIFNVISSISGSLKKPHEIVFLVVWCSSFKIYLLALRVFPEDLKIYEILAFVY